MSEDVSFPSLRKGMAMERPNGLTSTSITYIHYYRYTTVTLGLETGVKKVADGAKKAGEVPEEATSDARPRFEACSVGWEESAVQRAECEQLANEVVSAAPRVTYSMASSNKDSHPKSAVGNGGGCGCVSRINE
jgi:hypothetical protein